ncbi:hypothetical protein BHM03_00001020 [Ensete ventricosum]|nr:hypothetical protein BHM03_00001020 [Ensete ventricosum]
MICSKKGWIGCKSRVTDSSKVKADLTPGGASFKESVWTRTRFRWNEEKESQIDIKEWQTDPVFRMSMRTSILTVLSLCLPASLRHRSYSTSSKTDFPLLKSMRSPQKKILLPRLQR